MMYLVECDAWPEDIERVLRHALDGRSYKITRMDVIGEVVSASDGYPWKRLSYTDERTLAQLPERTPVYGEYK